jgi:hypothetical protein
MLSQTGKKRTSCEECRRKKIPTQKGYKSKGDVLFEGIAARVWFGGDRGIEPPYGETSKPGR